jgi:hypothetical protein
MTRRNTVPLAARAGVLSAETHSGSMNSSLSLWVSGAHRSATLALLAQVKPPRRQPVAVRSRASLSRQPQPRARRMPARASQGAGASARVNPAPSGKASASGRRNKARSGSTPTRRSRRRVSV